MLEKHRTKRMRIEVRKFGGKVIFKSYDEKREFHEFE